MREIAQQLTPESRNESVNMEFSGLIDELKQAGNTCENSIDAEKLSQINALKIQVKSLNNTLRFQNERIRISENTEEKICKHVSKATLHIVELFKDDPKILRFAKDLQSNCPLEDKIGELFRFLFDKVDSYEAKKGKKDTPETDTKNQSGINEDEQQLAE